MTVHRSPNLSRLAKTQPGMGRVSLATCAFVIALAGSSEGQAATRCDVLETLQNSFNLAVDAVRRGDLRSIQDLALVSQNLEGLERTIPSVFNNSSDSGGSVEEVANHIRAITDLASQGQGELVEIIIKSDRHVELLTKLQRATARDSCRDSTSDEKPDDYLTPLSSGKPEHSSSAPAASQQQGPSAPAPSRLADEPVNRPTAGTNSDLILDPVATPMWFLAVILACSPLFGTAFGISRHITYRRQGAGRLTPDLRAVKKLECAIPCLLSINDSYNFKSDCISISAEGCSLIAMQDIEKGDRAALYIADKAIVGEVMWRGRQTAGVKFLNAIEEEELSEILEYSSPVPDSLGSDHVPQRDGGPATSSDPTLGPGGQTPSMPRRLGELRRSETVLTASPASRLLHTALSG